MNKHYKNINENIYNFTTSTGLPVYIVKRNNLRTFYMSMLVNYGSQDLEYVSLKNKNSYRILPGTAHFLEHKLFESRDKSIFEKFSNQSASVNAYTNFSSTVYYFSCTDRIEDNILLLLDLMQDTFINDETVEKEKGIIIQEIKMYNDNPGWRAYNAFLSNLYARNNIRYDVAGTEGDVKAIDTELLMKCYSNFYTSDNMAAFIVGDVDEEKVIKLIEDSWKRESSIKNILRVYPHEPHKVVQSEVRQKMDVSERIFVMGFKELCTGITGKAILKREMLLKIILEYLLGTISPLYEKLYDSGYIDTSFSYGVNAHKQFIYTLISGTSRDPEYVRDAVLNQILKSCREGIESETIEMIKRMLIGNFIKTFDSEQALINNAVAYLNKGSNFFDIFDVISSVNTKEIEECLVEAFDPERFCISVIEPSD